MKDTLKLIVAGGVGSVIAILALSEKSKQEEIVDKPENKEISINPSIQRVTYLPTEKGDFISASKKTMDAVVHIKSKQKGDRRSQIPDPFRDFFGLPRYNQPQSDELIPTSTGSGVILSEDGYIVTNNHVIQDADELEITLNNNKSYVAEVIGSDPSTDLALLKIDASELAHLKFANSDQVQVGEWVLAVGNPFRLNSTVTSGIVSAKARNINILKNQNAIESFIQTDAAVNPGNSGGALVNTYGELIGINTAIASNTGSYTGYSFAVPSNIVSKVVKDLLDFGLVQRAYIGVSIKDMSASLAEEKNRKIVTGVYINNVVENGAGAEAGIKDGDIITAVNGYEIKNTAELLEKIGSKRPGDKIMVQLDREGKTLELPVVLKNKNGKTALIDKKDLQINDLLGAKLEVIDQGIKLSEVSKNGLIYKKSEIKDGFIIQKINGVKMTSIEKLTKTLEKAKGGVLVEGKYPKSNRTYYYGLGLD
jgi:Do/DeqQ family serine protease